MTLQKQGSGEKRGSCSASDRPSGLECAACGAPAKPTLLPSLSRLDSSSLHPPERRTDRASSVSALRGATAMLRHSTACSAPKRGSVDSSSGRGSLASRVGSFFVSGRLSGSLTTAPEVPAPQQRPRDGRRTSQGQAADRRMSSDSGLRKGAVVASRQRNGEGSPHREQSVQAGHEVAVPPGASLISNAL